MDRLSGDFNRGYTKAIQDVIEVFDYIQPDLKHHHKNLSAKVSVQLLNTILKERANIRDDFDGFIRWNCVKNEFEWFKRGTNNA